MAKTTDLVADLRACRHSGCSACGRNCGTVECIDHVIEDAADKIEELVDRCARYAEEIAVLRQTNEDTGLEPAVCANYKTFEDEAIGKGVPFKRIVALMEADRAGRLVVQPCKVGDTLFRVFAGEILEHKVSNMRYLAIQGRWDIDTTPFCSYVESSIGKTIFLTREEAEKALESMRKDGAAW